MASDKYMPLYTKGAFYVQYGASTAYTAAAPGSCLAGGTFYNFPPPNPFAQPWAISTLSLPEGVLSIGTTLRGDFYGIIKALNNSQTITFAVATGVVMVASVGAITLATITGNSPLHLWFTLVVTGYSATAGTLRGMMGFEYSAATAGGVALPIIGGEVATAAYDTTIARTISLLAGYGGTDPANTLTINRGVVELIG
jgi:hypothetical protein